jgi:Cell division protein CrgA
MARTTGSKRGRSAQGRATPKGGGGAGRYSDPEASGRYTKAVPTSKKVSPRWWASVMLLLMLLGVVVILLNYLSVFGTPSGWFMIGGIVLIGGGFVMATGYR